MSEGDTISFLFWRGRDSWAAQYPLSNASYASTETILVFLAFCYCPIQMDTLHVREQILEGKDWKFISCPAWRWAFWQRNISIAAWLERVLNFLTVKFLRYVSAKITDNNSLLKCCPATLIKGELLCSLSTILGHRDRLKLWVCLEGSRRRKTRWLKACSFIFQPQLDTLATTLSYCSLSAEQTNKQTNCPRKGLECTGLEIKLLRIKRTRRKTALSTYLWEFSRISSLGLA